ncbi:2,3-bisphosphoglycerate-dependent phosphoglycerate mutase [Alphaproteobacteria bacterium SO-S41]|nr:2,3-bisphosphoglycerate-dependent phosphoglycerate mutase [Alphaproteobacteria bacterium SO-S41]
MTTLALIRHGVTAWNEEGRIQGRADIPLSPKGIAELRTLRAPAALAGATWLTSPLRRARQTAELLHGDAATEDRLIETNWGAWEGLSTAITNPRAERLSARGQSGLDLRPPHGESPRDVQARLRPLFADLAVRGGAFVGVTHKGIIRATLSLALGWDMAQKPPVKLRWRAAHLFDLKPDGTVTLLQANLMLEPRA